jgi:hypothetical protein
MVVFAKDRPLPEALLNAKTAFVEKSETAEEYFDTYCKTLKVNTVATDKLQDKYCKALKKEAKDDALIRSAKNSRSGDALRLCRTDFTPIFAFW